MILKNIKLEFQLSCQNHTGLFTYDIPKENSKASPLVMLRQPCGHGKKVQRVSTDT